MKKDIIVTCKAWFWLIALMLYILVMAVPMGIVAKARFYLAAMADRSSTNLLPSKLKI